MTIVGVYLSFAPFLAAAAVELWREEARCKLEKETEKKGNFRKATWIERRKAVASSTHTHNVLGADNCTVSCESGHVEVHVRPHCKVSERRSHCDWYVKMSILFR